MVAASPGTRTTLPVAAPGQIVTITSKQMDHAHAAFVFATMQRSLRLSISASGTSDSPRHPEQVYFWFAMLIIWNENNVDGVVKSPISALRFTLVTAAYRKYASFLGIRKP
jgi:hypothetical protein